VNGEPPNYEVGWKRSKEIKLEEPVGYVIMDFVDKLVGLMDKESVTELFRVLKLMEMDVELFLKSADKLLFI
jgi:hypothetical protein